MRCWAFAFLAMMCATAAQASPCSTRTFEGDDFTICTFNARTEELRLVWKGRNGAALRSFDRVADDLGLRRKRVLFAMNAGMFETDGMPLGTYIEKGVRLRPLDMRSGGGNFYLKPNGVLSMNADGTLHIETTDTFAFRSDTPRWATQSGPMLVIDGEFNPQITADGPSKNLRNGVGLRDKHTALFVISDTPVSFGKLARLFRDELHCPDALYFDGAVSSAWIPSRHRDDNAVPLGPMAVVLAK